MHRRYLMRENGPRSSEAAARQLAHLGEGGAVTGKGKEEVQ